MILCLESCRGRTGESDVYSGSELMQVYLDNFAVDDSTSVTYHDKQEAKVIY